MATCQACLGGIRAPGRGWRRRGVLCFQGGESVHPAPCGEAEGSARRGESPEEQFWKSESPAQGSKLAELHVQNAPPRGRNATEPLGPRPALQLSQQCPLSRGTRPAPPQLPEWPPPGLLSWLCHLQASQSAALCPPPGSLVPPSCLPRKARQRDRGANIAQPGNLSAAGTALCPHCWQGPHKVWLRHTATPEGRGSWVGEAGGRPLGPPCRASMVLS